LGLIEVEKNDRLTTLFALSKEDYGRTILRPKHNPAPQTT